MNRFLAELLRYLNVLIALVLMLGGGVFGAKILGAENGGFWVGLGLGMVVAVLICGLLAVLLDIRNRLAEIAANTRVSARAQSSGDETLGSLLNKQTTPSTQVPGAIVGVAVILGVVVLGLVGPQLAGRVDNAKVTSATTQARMLKSALDTMRLDIGRYPTREEGLTMLVTAPTESRAASKWQGPYLSEDLPRDPWGYPYHYFTASPTSVYIVSYGADGQPGGDGMNADIVYPPQTSSNSP